MRILFALAVLLGSIAVTHPSSAYQNCFTSCYNSGGARYCNTTCN